MRFVHTQSDNVAKATPKSSSKSIQTEMDSSGDLYTLSCCECFSMDRIFNYHKHYYEVLQSEFFGG